MKQKKINQFILNQKLGDIIKVSYDLELVNKNAKNNLKTLIKVSEQLYRNQIDNIVDNVIDNNYKIIFITGPSSVGKTTSSIRIREAIKKEGYKAKVISLDDFFLNRDVTPLLADGSYDFENITAMDIPYFINFVKQLFLNKKAMLPKFDFISGKRTELREIQLEEDEFLIFEGLHTFNPIFQEHFKKFKTFKIFLSITSSFLIGSQIVITSKQLRFMRRILRDYYFRGESVNSTLKQWKNIRKGEDKFVTPYKSDADFILNTAHMYEPLLYDKYLKPLLKQKKNLPKIKQIIEIFDKTRTITDELIPKNSLIREFLPNNH